MDKHFERLKGYFYKSTTVMLVGFSCALFFFLYLLPNSTIVRIFPPLPSWYYIALGAVVGFYQGFTYRAHKIIRKNVLKHVTTYLLFLSEFVTMMFAGCLLSWPFYFVYLFFHYLFRLN